jgi:hypothetical protein
MNQVEEAKRVVPVEQLKAVFRNPTLSATPP